MAATKSAKRRGWFRFVIYLLLIIFVILVGGFIFFSRTVSKLETPARVEAADGIVVWTGKGGDRLSAAGQLLEKDLGERLLISGVNTALSDTDVAKLLSISSEKTACCIDIDYAAQDTIGNARETHNWLTSLGYEHIILVTSAYHMPRAVVEIRGLSGRVRITPYPVTETHSKAWWKDDKQRRRLLQEYGKLLLTYLRQAGNKSEREAPELPNLPKKPAQEY